MNREIGGEVGNKERVRAQEAWAAGWLAGYRACEGDRMRVERDSVGEGQGVGGSGSVGYAGMSMAGWEAGSEGRAEAEETER